ncbi:MAG: hypothetical protein A3E80_01170 [Chlamydiae bacterium RIFCSPHIGHO2_12_FULL_49_9]|nr:MAG: hypothetical protein A3E80_01170 [Chlamydiae bacterium RIFCSPHIGHO2_12_FULL_49_9]
MPSVDTLIVFGASSKYLSWLEEDKSRRLIQICEKKISHPRVKTYILETPIEIPLFAREIAWRTVFQKIEIVSLEKSPFFESFEKELKRCRIGADLLLSEAADFGKTALRNAKKNQSGAFRDWRGLEGKFSKAPAFVIGAGPSLKKHVDLLAKFQDRGLILAGGTALSALKCPPHFAAAIDPKTTPKNPFSQVPLCTRARAHPETLSIEGEKILFPDPALPILNWLYGVEGEFEAGWTVGNFLTRLAIHLGCNPIVFIGMDSCYIDGQKYGHLEHTAQEELIEVVDAKGRKLNTQRDWLGAIQWTEETAREKEDLLFINTSEEGVCFQKPVQEASLLQVIEEHAKIDLQLKTRVEKVIQELPFTSSSKKSIADEDLEEKLLDPLWSVWRHIFEREAEIDSAPIPFDEKMKLHKSLFFSQIKSELADV